MVRVRDGSPRGDDDFAEFVHVAWPGLYRSAYLLLGDRGLAEDLAQTALTKTYVAWARIEDPGAARAYAQRTLINTASSWFRRRSWRSERPSDDLPEASDGRHPGARVEVMEALASLPPRQRAVVVLRYYEDLSVAETADALGCSAGTVKSQTFEAFAKLRTLLGDAAVPETLGAHRG
ncbi:RNA polymerase sigma-70 factor, sigma-E family [Nocardioides exalbidus]|uniref:RNA polymerase sigma-70 factor, sigma-E family n=1 Tax=Nocardioides exalbidus TaxID=402596 RepID=A0A1H4Z4I2_9ACTN|nr:SigE family RNA polymerase sigma factor [Nocardioides exalbidus]SED24795.1 RNA polymerase sigma-70 factor, sigma-E family [Nocardioides exalbidus]